MLHHHPETSSHDEHYRPYEAPYRPDYSLRENAVPWAPFLVALIFTLWFFLFVQVGRVTDTPTISTGTKQPATIQTAKAKTQKSVAEVRQPEDRRQEGALLLYFLRSFASPRQ